MASGNSIMARLGLDTADFRSGLRNAESNVDRFVSRTRAGAASLRDIGKTGASGFIAGFAALGGLSVGKSIIDDLDRIGDLAQRTGESAEDIQKIGFAAKLDGASVEMLVKSMSKLTVEANKNSEGFAKVGIDAKNFLAVPLTEKVLLMADAYERAQGNAGQMASFMELLGNRAQDLIPLFSEGREKLNAMFEKAPVVADAAIASIQEMNDTLDAFVLRCKAGLGAVVGLFGAMAKDPKSFLSGIGDSLADLVGAGEDDMLRHLGDKVDSPDQKRLRAEAEKQVQAEGTTYIPVGRDAQGNETQRVATREEAIQRKITQLQAEEARQQAAADRKKAATRSALDSIQNGETETKERGDGNEKTIETAVNDRRAARRERLEAIREEDEAEEAASKDRERINDEVIREAVEARRERIEGIQRIAAIEKQTADLTLSQAQAQLSLEEEIQSKRLEISTVAKTMQNLAGEDLAKAKLKTAELNAQLTALRAQKREQDLGRLRETPQDRSTRRRAERQEARDNRVLNAREAGAADNEQRNERLHIVKPELGSMAGSFGHMAKPTPGSFATEMQNDIKGIKTNPSGSADAKDAKADPVVAALGEIKTILSTFDMGAGGG